MKTFLICTLALLVLVQLVLVEGKRGQKGDKSNRGKKGHKQMMRGWGNSPSSAFSIACKKLLNPAPALAFRRPLIDPQMTEEKKANIQARIASMTAYNEALDAYMEPYLTQFEPICRGLMVNLPQRPSRKQRGRN